MSVDDNEFLIPIEESRRARPASVEQKALGNRLARLVGSRLADRPSIGQGRGRRGGMDIDAPTGGVRGYRKPTLSNFDPDNDGWVDEGSTHPRFIGIDSPTRGTETARRMASGANEEYRGQHGAPERGAGAPLHDMLADGGIYPEDVYSADAIRFYGVGDNQLDPMAADLIRRYKGKPNAEVTIYRAVPLSNAKQIEKLEKQIKRYMQYGKFPPDVPSSVKPRTSESNTWYVSVTDEIERLKNLPLNDMKITPGDWVTPIREYAVMHGDGALNGEYQIIKKRVKAKDIYTAGDSWLEWGYDPEVTNKITNSKEILDNEKGAALSSGRIIEQAEAFGLDITEKVSKEDLDKQIESLVHDFNARVGNAQKNVTLGKKTIDLIKKFVEEGKTFTDSSNEPNATLTTLQMIMSQETPRAWPRGYPMPQNVAIEIAKQIHLARGDSETVAKIEEFQSYLKTVTPEQLSEDIRKAAEAYGKSIDRHVIVQTRTVRPFVDGSRSIFTHHDIEERQKAGVQSMSFMGNDTTTSARMKTEANLLKIPMENTPETTAVRPSSGYVMTRKAAQTRVNRFKETYGDDIVVMNDIPVGEPMERLSHATWKYGESAFILRPEVASRTRVYNDDTVALSMKDNPPLNLASLSEDGAFLGGWSGSSIPMLYDFKTGDTLPTPAGAFESSVDIGEGKLSYKEALVLGRFRPEEIRALMAPPKDFRKGSGDFSIVGMNPNYYNNASLLMDMAQARDELIQSHGIEVVPMISDGVFAIDDVEMFNSSMTNVWFDKNFGDKGLSKENIIPDDTTTPYEAWLRVQIESEELPLMEYRGPQGKSKEEQDVWRREELKKELSRVLSVKTTPATDGNNSRVFNQFEEQMGSRLSSGNENTENTRVERFSSGGALSVSGRFSSGRDINAKLNLERYGENEESAYVSSFEIGSKKFSVSRGGDSPGRNMYNGYLVAFDDDGKNVGYIDYNSDSVDKTATVAMTEVTEEYKRMGVASALLDSLLIDLPGYEISPGYTTDEGSAWWRRVTGGDGPIKAERKTRLSSGAAMRVGRSRRIYDTSVNHNDKRNPSELLKTSRDDKEYSSIRFNGDGYDIKTSESKDGFSVFIEDESGQIASLTFSEAPTGEATKLLSYKASKESQKAGVLEALLDHVLVKNPDTTITSTAETRRWFNYVNNGTAEYGVKGFRKYGFSGKYIDGEDVLPDGDYTLESDLLLKTSNVSSSLVVGTDWRKNEYTWDGQVFKIGNESIVFGAHEEAKFDDGIKKLPLNPFKILKLDPSSAEGRKAAERWYSAVHGANVSVLAESGDFNASSYVSALLYAASKGDKDAQKEFDEFAKYSDLLIEKLDSKLPPVENPEKALSLNSRMIHQTSYKPTVDKNGYLVLRPLEDFAQTAKDGTEVTVNRTTLHFAVNHLAEGHLFRKETEGESYVVIAPLDSFVKENPDSLENFNIVDTAASPPPGDGLRFPPGSYKLVEIKKGEDGRKKVEDILKADGVEVLTGGERNSGTPGADKAGRIRAQMLGVSSNVASDLKLAYLEEINRTNISDQKQYSDVPSGTSFFHEASKNALLRIANREENAWVSASRKSKTEDSLFLPSDVTRLASGEAPRYPREPTLGAFLGEADSYFGDSNSWEEFKKKYNDAEIVFLDYETTGLDFDEFGKATTNGNPTQIGLVRMKNGKEIGRLNLFMNPEEPLGEWSLKNLKDADGNPITNEWLATQMPMAEAHRQVVEFIGPDALIGVQNATFDKNVLDDTLRESGIDWTPRGYLDTRAISSLTLPVWSEDNPDGPHIVSSRDKKTKPSSSLAAITEYLGVELGDGHHNADADAFATSQVMQKIIDGAIEKNWNTAVLSKKRRDERNRLDREEFDADVEKFESDKKSFITERDGVDSERPSSGEVGETSEVDTVVERDDVFKRPLRPIRPRIMPLEKPSTEGRLISEDSPYDEAYGPKRRSGRVRTPQARGIGETEYDAILEMVDLDRKKKKLQKASFSYGADEFERTLQWTNENADREIDIQTVSEELGVPLSNVYSFKGQFPEIFERLESKKKGRQKYRIRTPQEINDYRAEQSRLSSGQERPTIQIRPNSPKRPIIEIGRNERELLREHRAKDYKYGDRSVLGGEIRKTTNTWLRGLSSEQMAKVLIPTSRDEHFQMWLDDYAGMDVVDPATRLKFQKYYDDFHQKNPWDTPDYSPENMKAMQELLAQTIEDNPQMKWAFENHGAPSFSFMNPEGIAAYEAIPEVREKFAAIAKQRNDGKPIRARGRMSPNMDTIYLNKDVFLEALDDSIPSATKSTLKWNGQPPVKGQKSIENSLAGTLLHEWGHWLHFKAIADSEGGPKTTIHTRQRYGSKDKGNTNYARALAVATQFNKFEYDQNRITMFENDVPFSETPDVPRLLTSYGNVNMAETMAEGIVAVLHPDEKVQEEMISPSLKKAVTTLLGGSNAYQPWRDGDRAGRILSSGRSPEVRDERRGRLEDALNDIAGLRLSSSAARELPKSKNTKWKKETPVTFVPIERRSGLSTLAIRKSKGIPATSDLLEMFVQDVVAIPGKYPIDEKEAAPKIKRALVESISKSMDFTPQEFIDIFQSTSGGGYTFAGERNFRDVSLILSNMKTGRANGGQFYLNPKDGIVISSLEWSTEEKVLNTFGEEFGLILKDMYIDDLFSRPKTNEAKDNLISKLWTRQMNLEDGENGVNHIEMRKYSADIYNGAIAVVDKYAQYGNRYRRKELRDDKYLGIFKKKDGTLIAIDSDALDHAQDILPDYLEQYGLEKGKDFAENPMEIRVALIDKNTPDTGDDFKTFRQFMQQEIGKAIPTPDSMREKRGVVSFDAATPEGQAVLKQSLVSGIIHTWAISANDSNDVALSIQNIAREIFSTDGAVGWDRNPSALTHVTTISPGQTLEDFDGAPVLTEMQRKFIGEFLLTSHEATQKYFADRNITHVPVYRGLTAHDNAFGQVIELGDMDTRRVLLRPLSSWSLSPDTALGFAERNGAAGDGYVVKAFVPISDVLSIPFTGFGCLEEDEVVLIGHPLTGMVKRIYHEEIARWQAQDTVEALADVDMDTILKQVEVNRLSSGETDVLERPTPYKADTRFNTFYEKEKRDEQSSYMRRFAQALEHYNKTGDWLGGDFDVVVTSDKNMNAPTIHSPEAQAKNLLKSDIATRAEDAFVARHESWTRYPGSDKEPERDSFVKNWIKKFEDDINEKSRLLKEEVALLQYKHDSKQVRIEQNVLDLEDITPEEYDDLLKETQAILELKQNNRDKYWELFGYAAPGGEKFLIHQGSSELDGGVLNPQKTVGSEGFNVSSADTKALNNINVADIKARNNQIEKQVEELKKFIESASTDGTINAGNYNRNSLGLISSNLSQEFRQNSPDRVIDLAARGWDVTHFISEAHKTIARLEKEQVDVRSVVKALEEANDQFLSALMAGEELAGGYFGRYAHRIIPKHIAENFQGGDWDFENKGKDLKVHDQLMLQRWRYAMRGTQWIIGGEQHKHWTNKLGPGDEKQIIGMQRPFVGFSSVTLNEERNRLYAITPALIVRAIKNYKQGNKKVDLSTLVKPRSIPGAEALQPDELNQELRMSSGKKKVVESIMNANYHGIVSARHIEHTSKDGNKTNYWVVLDAGGTITAYDAESVNDTRQKLSESWTKLGLNPITDKKGPVPVAEVNILDALKKMDDRNQAIGLMTTWSGGSMRLLSSQQEIFETKVTRSRRRTGIASEMMRLHRDTWPEQNLQHSEALSPNGRAFAASATPEVLDGQRESVGANVGKKLSSGLTEHVTNEHAKSLVAAYPKSLKEPTDDIAIARKEGRPVSWLLDETIDPKIGAVIGELIDGVLDDPRFKKAFDGRDINPFLLENSKGPWARIGEKSPFSERIGPAVDKITEIVMSRDPKMTDWDAETIAKGLVLRAGIHITRAKYIENERRKILMSMDLHAGGTVEDVIGEYDKYAKELIGMGGDYFQPGPMDYNRVVVAIDKQAIDGLVKNKRLLSQFETGRSNGHYDPRTRAQTEVTLFGYPPDMAPEFRPIYGMAAYGGVTEEVAAAGQHYGNYLVVLKPDAEKRTTVTESDSLSLMGTTSAMSSPDVNMMMLRNAGDRDTFDYPVEAQVHPGEGGITLDDIAYIIVRDDYTGENPDEETKLQELTSKLGVPAVSEYDMDYGSTQGAFDEDYILNAGRLSSGRSNRRLRKGRPGAKPRYDSEEAAYSANELAIRSVPSSPEELASVLRNSPHTKNSNKSIRKINQLIEELEINWDKQKELQKKVELTLSNSPSLRNMLGRFDIPPMLLTNFGLKEGFIFESNLEPANWYAGGGVYTPQYGFIAFPDKVLKDYIPGTNLTGEYVIRHELGHAIHAMAKKTNKDAFKRESEDLDGLYKELKAAASWAKDEIKTGRSLTEIQDEISSMVNMLSEYDSSLAKQISDYAATNRAEYIAEAIAYATAPSNEGLRRLRAEHYDMLAEFLGLTVEELKMMGL